MPYRHPQLWLPSFKIYRELKTTLAHLSGHNSILYTTADQSKSTNLSSLRGLASTLLYHTPYSVYSTPTKSITRPKYAALLHPRMRGGLSFMAVCYSRQPPAVPKGLGPVLTGLYLAIIREAANPKGTASPKRAMRRFSPRIDAEYNAG